MSNTPYHGAFFDLGGTLFHHLDAEHTAQNVIDQATELGLKKTDADDFLVRYKSHRKSVELEALSQAYYLHRHLVAEAYARTLAEWNLRSPTAVRAFCDAQAQSVVTHLRLREDTIDVLTQLAQAQRYISIVSNIDDDYFLPLLKKHDLAKRFDHCLSSHQALSCKPHGQIFTQALDRSGLCAKNVVFVGDSVVHDVVGARRMGMDTAWLVADQIQPSSEHPATYTINSLTELLDLMQLS